MGQQGSDTDGIVCVSQSAICGGRIQIARSRGPLYVDCFFQDVEFAVPPNAQVGDQPLFVGCNFDASCSGQIGSLLLAKPQPS